MTDNEDSRAIRKARKKAKHIVGVGQPLRRHGMSSLSINESVNLLMVFLETEVEVPNDVVTSSRNQAQNMIASDLDGGQEETPKPNKYRRKGDSRSLANFSADGDVSEPELPFKSPRTLLNASQARRTTKKTYAEAVSGGSESESEAEVRMRKKAAQQERHEGVVERSSESAVRNSTR